MKTRGTNCYICVNRVFKSRLLTLAGADTKCLFIKLYVYFLLRNQRNGRVTVYEVSRLELWCITAIIFSCTDLFSRHIQVQFSREKEGKNVVLQLSPRSHSGECMYIYILWPSPSSPFSHRLLLLCFSFFFSSPTFGSSLTRFTVTTLWAQMSTQENIELYVLFVCVYLHEHTV